jgi:hypothetical protein
MLRIGLWLSHDDIIFLFYIVQHTTNAIFTQMQDDSNLRQPPKWNTSPMGKCIYPHLKWSTRNNAFAKKNILLSFTSYTEYTNCVRFYLHVAISVTVSIFIVSALTFLTRTPNFPILFTAIPQHITISPTYCTRYTALMKTLHNHFLWDALPCCYEPNWLNNTFIFLGL